MQRERGREGERETERHVRICREREERGRETERHVRICREREGEEIRREKLERARERERERE